MSMRDEVAQAIEHDAIAFRLGGMHDDVAHAIEHGAMALKREEQHNRALRKGGPTSCASAAAASVDRDNCRTESSFQNRFDLARRVAASTASAGWAAVRYSDEQAEQDHVA